VSQPNRPGPRSDVDVPSLLVEVAEQMFGERGVDAVSLRAVARGAGVSSAAVGYHFPSKAILVAAVVRRRADLVSPLIRARLAGLCAQPTVSAAELVDAVLGPLVTLLEEDPVGALHWLKLFAHVGITGDELWQHVLDQAEITSLFEQAAARAMAGPMSPALRLRVSIAFFSMLTALASSDLGGYGRSMGESGLDPVFVTELATFTAAGIAAG
jgi:AcrR family transcriptional regulator